MRKTLAFSVLALAFAAPAGAQTPAGMGAMQYYVGTWSCTGGPVGPPAQKATLTYTLDSGIMRQLVVVPVQGKMTKPYALSSDTTYDAKKGRFVSTANDSGASWGVSVAKPWTGNTEQWTDIANSDGKLGHGKVVRTDKDDFDYIGYPTSTGTKPNFKVTCKRSS